MATSRPGTYNTLHLTKIWHGEFPLCRAIGKIVLNENPQNYFAEIKQGCVSASNTRIY